VEAAKLYQITNFIVCSEETDVMMQQSEMDSSSPPVAPPVPPPPPPVCESMLSKATSVTGELLVTA